MITHYLHQNPESEKDFKLQLARLGCKIIISQSGEELFENCIDKSVQVLIVHENCGPQTYLYNLIRDLRFLFGSYPLIIVTANKTSLSSKVNYFDAGADCFFKAPYDLLQIEDALSRKFSTSLLRPIQYRSAPSGGIPVTVTRKIELKSLSSEGITFLSNDFLGSGTIISFPIGDFLKLAYKTLKFKIIKSVEVSMLSEDCLTDLTKKDCYEYIYYANFFEVPLQELQKIRFQLKMS